MAFLNRIDLIKLARSNRLVQIDSFVNSKFLVSVQISYLIQSDFDGGPHVGGPWHVVQHEEPV